MGRKGIQEIRLCCLSFILQIPTCTDKGRYWRHVIYKVQFVQEKSWLDYQLYNAQKYIHSIEFSHISSLSNIVGTGMEV